MAMSLLAREMEDGVLRGLCVIVDGELHSWRGIGRTGASSAGERLFCLKANLETEQSRRNAAIRVSDSAYKKHNSKHKLD